MDRLIEILVIEDSEAERTLIEDVFAEASIGKFSLRAATRLSQAKELLASNPANLVLLDLNLPDSNGLETLDSLLTACPELPVIVLTGLADHDIGKQAIQRGAQDFLIKGSGTEIILPRICFYTLERLRVQAQARLSDDMLRTTIDSLNSYVAIVDIDGSIMLTNQAWQNCKDTVPESADHRSEENTADAPETVDAVISSDRLFGTVQEGDDYFAFCRSRCGLRNNLENELVQGIRQVISSQQPFFEREYPCRFDGETSWFHVRVSRLHQEKAACAVISHEDISHRKEAELELRRNQQALAESELLLRTILNAMQHWIVLVDTGFKVIWANKYAVEKSGKSLPELIGSSCSEVWHQGEPCYMCPAQKALRTGDLEVEIKRLSSGLILRITGCPVLNNQGEISGVVFMAEDISDRVSLEQQLRQAQKMESLGTLAGGIAHDFNNILTAILGFTELSLANHGEDGALTNDLQEVLQASLRARDLVRQILTFSRRIEQELRPLDISLVVKEALKLLRASLPATISLDSDIPTGLGLVMADPTQIHQIVMNLCTNAAHAMRHNGGSLTIVLDKHTVEKQGDALFSQLNPGPYLRLRFSDTGCGISQENLSYIFDPYFTTKEPGEGTGLGLAVVHGIIKDYGGEIVALSDENNGGTCFTIVLPQVAREEDTPEELMEGARPYEGKGEQIVVVDDEPAILQVCRKLLERKGYQVRVFKDSRKALQAIRVAPEEFDFLLTDMVMPYMTGEQLALAARQFSPRLPVVIMSGNMSKLPEALVHLGRISALAKPLEQRQLLQRIRSMLDEDGPGDDTGATMESD